MLVSTKTKVCTATSACAHLNGSPAAESPRIGRAGSQPASVAAGSGQMRCARCEDMTRSSSAASRRDRVNGGLSGGAL